MFLKRTLLAGFLAASFAPAAQAQTQTLDDITRVSRSAIEPIYAGNEVKGYVLYAKGDKADRKNDNYRLDFFDQDLNKVSNITLQKPANKYFLLRNAFNGSAFALYYFNQKDKTLEIESYDTNLKKLGFKAIGELQKVDLMMMQQVMQQQASGGGDNIFGGLTLFPVPGQGFVRNSFEGMMHGFNLQMYDNNLNPKWRLSSSPKSKFYESITITEATDKYLLATILRRDGLMSKEITAYMVAIDAATGKKILDVPVETAKTENLSLNSFSFDATKREFVALGEYYKTGDKPFVNKSQGFYIKRFNELGKAVGAKNYGWQNEVRALMPAEARPSVEEGFVNFTQSIVRGANGKTYIVAEQFKIVADGLGIAATVLNGGGGAMSVSKGKVANMFIFALDADYKLTDVKFYAKDESRAVVPPGAGFAGTGLLGNFFRASGQFDYQFMQKNDANSQFNVVYINYDKEKGEKTKKVIGNIAFGDNGQFKVDKIDGSSNATSSFLYPAKPGYLMVVDYLKKEKQIGMKLVKLNI